MVENGYSMNRIEAVMAEINKNFKANEMADHIISVPFPSTIECFESFETQGYVMGHVTTDSLESYDRVSRSRNMVNSRNISSNL